jgi:hypothetical protein
VTPPSRRETVVFALAAATLILPPWLVGAWDNWSQWVTLALAALAFLALFAPMFDFRGWPPSPTARVMARRLIKFPIFWIGLAILAYGALAAINPSRILYVSRDQQWLEDLPHVSWLPHSIVSPFWPMNAWRALVVLAPAWLATCAAWCGLETEQSWRRLLGAVAANGTLLALLGVVQRLSGTRKMFWFYDSLPNSPEPEFFGSFIYAGHAAAWMALAFGAAAAMMDYGLRRRDPDSPPRNWGWPMLTAWVWLGAIVVIWVTLTLFVKPDFWAIAPGGVLLVCAILWLTRWWRAGQKRRAALYALPTLLLMAAMLLAIGAALWWWRQGGVGQPLQVNPHDPALPVRYAIARTAVGMIQQEPVVGWGPGSFRYVTPYFLLNNPDFDDPLHPGQLRYSSHYAESDWVQIPAEWGAVGAGLFAAALLWWAGKAWVMRRLLPGESWIVLGAVALVFAGAWADCPLYNPAILICLGVLLATAVKLGEIAGRPRPTMSNVIIACP